MAPPQPEDYNMATLTSTDYWKSDAYRIQHIGWLLSSEAPDNLAKGQRLLAEAPDDIKVEALVKAKELKDEMHGLRTEQLLRDRKELTS